MMFYLIKQIHMPKLPLRQLKRLLQYVMHCCVCRLDVEFALFKILNCINTFLWPGGTETAVRTTEESNWTGIYPPPGLQISKGDLFILTLLSVNDALFFISKVCYYDQE